LYNIVSGNYFVCVFSTASPHLGKYLSAAGYEKKKIKGRCGAGFSWPVSRRGAIQAGRNAEPSHQGRKSELLHKNSSFQEIRILPPRNPTGIEAKSGVFGPKCGSPSRF